MPRIMAVWKHPQHHVLYLREPIPPDLWAAAGGKKTYKRSLGTTQQTAARQKYPAALAAFTAYLDGLRNGPKRLTAKEVEGLVGIWYREKLAAWEANPGAPEDWESTWLALPSGDTPEDLRARCRIVSPYVDALLEDRGLSVDADTHALLEERLFLRLVTLVSVIESRASGDYSPDPTLLQFPEPPAPPVPRSAASRQAATGGLNSDGTPTWPAMFDRWEAGARRRPDTVAEFRRVWDSFRIFTRCDQPSEVDTHHVESWRASVKLAGISGKPLKDKTVQGKYLAAVSAIYAESQGKGRGRLSENPVGGAWLKGRKFTDSDEVRPYNSPELAAILRAARSESVPERRWLPWLMVYSGARFREAAQCIASDIRELDGIPYLSINEDHAWKRLKNPSSKRNIPLHSALIDEGFLVYVRSLGPGDYLFHRIKPRANGQPNEGRPVTTLREWLHSLVETDATSRIIVRPTHSIRHAFEDMIREATTDSELRLDIQGREYGSSASDYGNGFTMRKMLAALECIPRLV